MRHVVLAVLLVLGGPGLATAQEAGLTGAPAGQRGPRFYAASPGSAEIVPVEASRVPALRRRVTLDLADVSLREALETISRDADVRINYSASLLPRDVSVSIGARNLTVAAVLTEILLDAEVDVVVMPSGQLTLRKRGPVEVGTVTGRVTDANTGEVLVGADVRLEGTRWRASTGEDGRYRLVDVVPGEYTLEVRRIGYRRESRAVTVRDGEEVVVDVGLEAVPTQLDEVVTTATGEQRLRELGHVVGRINADSLVKEAPISSVSDLLMGRVSGLQVFQSQGTVGGEVTLQVRGPNSVLLNTEPIVIVDGVRYASTPVSALSSGFGPAATEPTSPLNDLNPNDIASIEVVKGPSAATLYGTDAANGVIVITTKRGRPGPARWNAYARLARTSIPARAYPDRYVAFGTRPSGTTTSFCRLDAVATGSCTQDSIVRVPNPLNDPDLTIFGSQPRREAGLSVAGGGQDVQYYFAAGVEDATGPVVMPRVVLEQLEAQRGTAVPDKWHHPNTRTNLNLRTNVTAQLSSTAELSVHAGYIRGATRTLAVDNPYARGIASGDPTNPYGRSGTQPEEAFAGQSTERTNRFVGNVMAQWRPTAWLVTRATLGLDLGSRHRVSLVRHGDAPSNSFVRDGSVSDDRARQVATTADVSATATVHGGRLSARTSMGVQYVRSLTDALANSGLDLPPGGSSVPEAAMRFPSQSYTEAVTLGSYLEETLGLNDRLFVTGALRVDGASAFGQNYDATVYPKVSVSWLASEEPSVPRVPGLDELRLRYAYGASGQQPQPAWARPAYRVPPEGGILNNAPATVVDLTSVGNPDIRPERVREHEFGFDATALGSRLSLGLTWYQRRTVDQIVLVPLAVGYGSRFTNLGLTTQRGFEAELTAHLLDTRLLSWDVLARHSLARTKLVELGGGSESRRVEGGYAEGYPLGARFLTPYTYTDANGDGIIHRSEQQFDFTETEYAGENTPPISQTLTTMLGLFNRQVRVSALLERRAGFTQIDALKTAQCNASGCLARLVPGTPLAEQAKALAASRGLSPYLQPGNYTRLREVTLAFDLPSALLDALRVRSATVSLSGRNLALWTDFSGHDPESSTSSSSSSAGGIPQGRTWTLRFDLGL